MEKLSIEDQDAMTELHTEHNLLGDVKNYFEVSLFFITVYLIFNDLTILSMNCVYFKDWNQLGRIMFYMLIDLSMDALVFNVIMYADDETIVTEYFWGRQSWVALIIWMRILTYLSQTQTFSWIMGLIKHSCSSTLFFLSVFICGVTAFADSFNALE